MTLPHPLEKRRFADIRAYISKYTQQIKSLSELRDMINRQFGIDYTLNQINYFQGKTGGVPESNMKEDSSSDEALNFVRLLKKYKEDHLYVEYDPTKAGNIDVMFYSSLKMKENYLKNRDILFINKRLSQNRFGKSLVLFLTVSPNGRSLVVAFALIDKEEPKYF